MEKNSFDKFDSRSYARCYWHKWEPKQYIILIEKANDLLIKYSKELSDLVSSSYSWYACSAIYSSNKIEDTGLSLEETKNIVIEYLNPNSMDRLLSDIEKTNDQSRKEVLQHLSAFQYLCRENLHSDLSEDIILETHRLLMNGLVREDGMDARAGSYRDTDITVGKDGQPCVSSDDIVPIMKRLATWFNQIKSKPFDPFVTATILKTRFLHIHPFIDGNGRLSRLLMNWVLLSKGLPFPISLQAGFSYQAKKNYFHCFNANDPTKPLSSLVLESVHTHFCSFFERVKFTKPEIPPFISSINSHTYFDRLPTWRDGNGYDIDQMQDMINKYTSENNYDVIKMQKIFNLRALQFAIHSRIDLQGSNLTLTKDHLTPIIINDYNTVTDLSTTPHFKGDFSRTLEEMTRLTKAFRYLCVDKVKSDLNVELILSTLHILFNSSTSYRTDDVYIGSHLFPSPHCLKSNLETIVNSYKEKVSKIESTSGIQEKIVISTWLMYEILALHPFQDGNGRISRLLLNWSLLHLGSNFPVIFGKEKGVKHGHRDLVVSIQLARSNLGSPTILATRVLLSLYNAWESLTTDK
ncbi:hypothetical protein PPL_00220 [Heterostelium album PN500]|uniref:Fido domain-containing protein n=1 Tax=Heterostelium pallidum (strain ATCC 26659 / Pp 5 / PN500) TaxID=670386 RepID=D3AVV5_HETP5|nr:hypothetical protein PPL_00220 [Heterostelium album PN500]EFA86428.1 hypothetical protein PPL_00220 [Heterostelium album PN500]|eukprot:XP_020438533.1 hypothetical protein PPL_00220 [Heterostelium album PN500]